MVDTSRNGTGGRVNVGSPWSRRIRILHVLNAVQTGGTELAVLRLIKRLDPKRFEHIICSLTPGVDPAIQVSAPVLQAATRFKSSLPSLYRLIRTQTPDVVHSRNWGAVEAIPAARLARVPSIIHSEHGRSIATMNSLPVRRRVLLRIAYSMADCVFAVSDELREFYAKQTGFSGISVLANGVDTSRFKPDGAARAHLRRARGFGDSTIVVGCVGRLDPVKDHSTLMRAVEALLRRGKDVALVIAGDGPERERLESLVSASPVLEGKVFFAGTVADTPRWLNAFDIFVLPSLSEGMSNTVLEAMASELPVVASRIGGNTELIRHGHSGLLFEPGDAEELEKVLECLIAEPDTRASFASHARERVEMHFSLDQMVQRYTTLYERAVLSKSDAR